MKLFRGLIYILQKEAYNPARFLALVYRDWRWWALENRQAIDWTPKARAVFIIFCACLAAIIAVIGQFGYWGWILLAVFLWPLLPLVLLLAWALILPLDYFLKARVLRRARRVMRSLDVTVIGITGSYGKTSLKEILAIVLGSEKRVVKTPDNINTDLGIAYFIWNHRAEIAAADFFIVEMGAYHRGDIAKICALVNPQYSCLTGINEAHLERFGSLENTIAAKFELGERTTKKAVLNFTDQNVQANYQRFQLPGIIGVNYETVAEMKALPDFAGWTFKYDQQSFSSPWLAKHNVLLIAMALALAKELGVNLGAAVKPLASAPFIKNRLEPIYNRAAGLLISDDSDNGNWSGFVSGLEVLARAAGRKLVITPGLVEVGDHKEVRHRALARLYADYAVDFVMLIKNSATVYIADEFEKIKFNHYHVYNDAASAHKDLGSVLKSGDTIIFQNDWPDNYK